MKNSKENIFPKIIDLRENLEPITPAFRKVWSDMMEEECHQHSVWKTEFARKLNSPETNEKERFELAATWSTNMIRGSFCFPAYVSALAARAPADVIRHGLLDNAWDESGGEKHTERSHYWLAVRLGKLLGFSEKEIKDVDAVPEAQAYTNEHLRQCKEGDFGFALGMLSLIEEFTTPEFTMIRDAFLRSSETGLGMPVSEFVNNEGEYYFNANIQDDERHREEMPKIAAAYISAMGADLENERSIVKYMKEIRQGVLYSADLRKKFFEGISRYVASGRTYKDLVA